MYCRNNGNSKIVRAGAASCILHTFQVKFGSYSKDSSRLVFAPGADLASGNNFFEDAAETTSPFSFEFMGDLPDDQTYYESAYGIFSITGFQVTIKRDSLYLYIGKK